MKAPLFSCFPCFHMLAYLVQPLSCSLDRFLLRAAHSDCGVSFQTEEKSREEKRREDKKERKREKYLVEWIGEMWQGVQNRKRKKLCKTEKKEKTHTEDSSGMDGSHHIN